MDYKKHLLGLLVVFLSFNCQSVFAQVSGISYTLSPNAEYTWWGDQAGIEDGFSYGGKLGFSFGENLELRGTYLKGLNLQTNFSNFGLKNYSDSLFTARDVDYIRYGGELKANLSKGNLLPYLTLGTGIQSIQLDTFDTNKQIYVTVGAGIKISAGDRYTLNIEAKNTQYNFNTGRNLLTAEDKATFGVTDEEFTNDRIGNWSLSAGLQFYLGGRRPGQMSALDKAYFNTFSDGLQGLRIPIELTVARMNFDEKLPFRDTWMGGAYAGFDFSPFVGVRGFYLKSMENGEFSTKFDPLAMYGGEIRMKLNVSRGLTPFVMVGGGYLNVGDDYVGRDSIAMQAESKAFALGGIGANLPLSNRFKIFGAARANLTSGTNVEDLESTEDVQTSWSYSFGVNLVFGQKSNAGAVAQSQVDAAVQAQQTVNDENSALLKQNYEQKVVDLENKLNEAYAQQDIEKAAVIMREKQTAEQVVAELEMREAKKLAELQQRSSLGGFNVMSSGSRIQMSPAEFENLIEEILENMGSRGQALTPAVEQQLMGQQNMQQLLQQQEMDKRIGEIEKLLIQMNERQAAAGNLAKVEQAARDEAMRRDLTEFSAKLLFEIQKLNAQIQQNGGTPIQIDPTNMIPEQPQGEVVPTTPETNAASVTSGNVLGVKTGGDYLSQDTSFFSKLRYEGMSGFSGFNIGGQTTFNLGFRWHYGIGNSKFELMPEAFFGFGSPSAFGLTLNGVLPIELKNTPITPYLGAGAGFMQIAENGDDKLRLNYNFIFGSYLKAGKGRLYVDFTARNLFKYNQIIAGYRFPF